MTQRNGGPTDGRFCENSWLSEFLGEFTRYDVQVGTRRLTADAAHLSSSRIFPLGSRVQVGIDPAELRLLP